MEYKNYLKNKEIKDNPTGFTPNKINEKLYDFQKDIVKWSIKRGRSAIFADCGLGKTPLQLEWAHHVYEKTKKSILIFAPLAVSLQTIREGKKFNIDITLVHGQEDIKSGIYITNYEKLHRFDFSNISGIILDESSILKSYNGKFRTEIIEKSLKIPYKLCCTATPAPNDYMELGNHAEFLGVMRRTEMLSMFFIHDSGSTQKWRLKGHACNKFWQWLSTWAVVIRKPSDLGYDDGPFTLPKLNYYEHMIKSDNKPKNMLFALEAKTLSERRDARRNSIDDRTIETAKIINGSAEQWLIWCNLNAESEALSKNIKGAVQITGSDKQEYKEKTMIEFSNGDVNKIVTKPLIAGFGLNWQNCHNMAFVGLSDSYEQFYQATRRCWRFGQKKPVNVHIIITEEEGSVLKNIKRKEKDAKRMYSEMVKNMSDLSKKQIKGSSKNKQKYETKIIKGKSWEMIMGDCVEETKSIKSNSIGYSVFSPPFAELYTYSDSLRDMGNSKNYDSFFNHFKFLVKELYRVIENGRLVTIHCIDIPAMKERDGYIGLKDFPSDIRKLFQDAGFIYHSRTTIWKNPLIEATRTKALGLMHKQLCKDSAMCRQGLPDYLITMRKPGENKKPIKHGDGIKYFIGKDEPIEKGIKYSHEVWRRYASPIWMDINQSNTLNKVDARSHNDEKHICPLQLDVIGRCLMLWSNDNDLVFSPFAGIGSEGHEAIKMGRNFIGIELKESYFNQAVKNLKQAEYKNCEKELFD